MPPNGQVMKVVDSAWFRFLQPILTALLVMGMAWLVSTVVEIERDLAVIRGNRFTSQDGLHLLEELRSHESILGHAGMTQRVGLLEATLTRIESKLDRLIENGR